MSEKIDTAKKRKVKTDIESTDFKTLNGKMHIPINENKLNLFKKIAENEGVSMSLLVRKYIDSCINDYFSQGKNQKDIFSEKDFFLRK